MPKAAPNETPLFKKQEPAAQAEEDEFKEPVSKKPLFGNTKEQPQTSLFSAPPAKEEIKP